MNRTKWKYVDEKKIKEIKDFLDFPENELEDDPYLDLNDNIYDYQDEEADLLEEDDFDF